MILWYRRSMVLRSLCVMLDDREATAFTSAKVQALFYYLAVTGDIQRRTTHAALLWPEAPAMQTLAFSHDGLHLAGSNLAGNVFLWRLNDAIQGNVVQYHGAVVRALAFSPDDRLLARASDDGSVCIWCTTTGTRLHELTGHQGFVCAIAFDRSGRFVASGSYDRTLRLWDTASGRLQRVIGNVRAAIFGAIKFHRSRLDGDNPTLPKIQTVLSVIGVAYSTEQKVKVGSNQHRHANSR